MIERIPDSVVAADELYIAGPFCNFHTSQTCKLFVDAGWKPEVPEPLVEILGLLKKSQRVVWQEVLIILRFIALAVQIVLSWG